MMHAWQAYIIWFGSDREGEGVPPLHPSGYWNILHINISLYMFFHLKMFEYMLQRRKKPTKYVPSSCLFIFFFLSLSSISVQYKVSTAYMYNCCHHNLSWEIYSLGPTIIFSEEKSLSANQNQNHHHHHNLSREMWQAVKTPIIRIKLILGLALQSLWNTSFSSSSLPIIILHFLCFYRRDGYFLRIPAYISYYAIFWT